MNKSCLFALAPAGVVLFFLLGFVSAVFSFRTEAISLEENIKAQYSQNQNNYDNMWKRFKEVSQVTDLYSGDLKKLYDGAITARYGEEGSKAMFQWIREQNPNLDVAVYTKLQTVIESGRVSFEADQKQLIDKKRVYEVLLRSNRALFVNWILKFPKIDLTKYDIVISEATSDAFETKRADEVKLR